MTATTTQLAPLRSAPRCALLPLVVRSFNKGYTENASARHFPKFYSVSLRKTSYIPDVIGTLNILELPQSRKK
jgi:hypothetical protein